VGCARSVTPQADNAASYIINRAAYGDVAEASGHEAREHISLRLELAQ
jgi:hypothetical protein